MRTGIQYLLRHILGNNSGQNISRALSSGSDLRNFRAATDAESRTYCKEFQSNGHNRDNTPSHFLNILQFQVRQLHIYIPHQCLLNYFKHRTLFCSLHERQKLVSRQNAPMSILLSINHALLISLLVPKDYWVTNFLNLKACATDNNVICRNSLQNPGVP